MTACNKCIKGPCKFTDYTITIIKITLHWAVLETNSTYNIKTLSSACCRMTVRLPEGAQCAAAHIVSR